MSFFKFMTTGITALALGGYCFASNHRLITTEYTISCEKLPQKFSGKKILHLSDLHQKTFGENYDILINSCKATHPNFIFFTGDLYSRAETDLDKKLILMSRLKEIAPVYYIFGNHETETPNKAVYLAEKLKELGIIILRNQVEKLYIDDEFINIYGLDIPLSFFKNADGGYKNLPKLQCDDINQLVGKSCENEFNILLAHSPFPFEEYAKWGADLIFSGHCHGGIIRLPFLGGILSPERKFFPKYTKGVYRCEKHGNNAQMVVSAGLGKFRMGNPAEIVIINLKSTERNDENV